MLMAYLIHTMNLMIYARGMQQGGSTDAPALVRNARAIVGETQRAFARRLGTLQSLICKYERAEVSPPADVLIHCMNLLRIETKEVTAEDLIALVKARLGGPGMSAARRAVAEVIHCLPPKEDDATG